MSKAWPLTKLGDVLQAVSRGEGVQPAKEYKLLGIRLEGQGPFLREVIAGTQTSANKLFRVAAGDFIYSRLFACRGAFGVIDSSLDGCFVSNEFPTFVPDPIRIDVNFLKYWFRLPSVIARVDKDCTGSTPLTRNRYKEEFFLRLEIQLPPLAEQRRIVVQIENFSHSIETVIKLGAEKLTDADSLLVSMAHRADLSETEKKNSSWEKHRLGDVIRLVSHAETVKVDAEYPNLGIYSFGRGLFHKPPISGLETSAKSLYRVRRGQFIYSRLFAFEGAYGMVDDEFDGKFVSNEYPTFECNADAICPEFLVAYFKPSSMWARVAEGSKGLGDRRQRVQPAQILNHELWLPPIAWQKRLIEVKKRIDQIRKESATTQAEVEGLMPAILDRAFKGGLV